MMHDYSSFQYSMVSWVASTLQTQSLAKPMDFKTKFQLNVNITYYSMWRNKTYVKL